MAKFRTKSEGTKTENLAGGTAFTETPKLELVSLLLTSFVQDKFYRSAKQELKTLKNLVSAIPDKKIVAKAAAYARNEFGMRSITHALIGELVHIVKGESWTKKAVYETVKRPDDMLEILGYYGEAYGKPFPNSLKKGLRDALGKFDAYQISKYRGEKSSVKMVDLLNLVHPKPGDNKETFEKLMKGELKSTQTWESKMTKAGQDVKDIEDVKERETKKKELKANAWKDLIKEKKLGYFALLRNLRNILDQAPDMVDDALKSLTDESFIKKSLVLPFRFTTAMREIEQTSFAGTRATVVALSKALDISVQNVPKFDGKTLVVLDESGSMNGQPMEIGSLFSAILYKSNDADMMMFSDRSRFVNLNPTDSVTTIASQLAKSAEMNGTNFNTIFQGLDNKYDRIIILSDMQGWMATGYSMYSEGGAPTKVFADYKKRTGADPLVYSFDLQGYGTLMFPERNVFAMTGWSEKIFDVMKLLEQDRDALVNTIDNYLEL